MPTNSKAIMLTTIDNPFNPFTEFDKWFAFDVQQGYNTCGLIARIAVDSPELSDIDQHKAIVEAINSILNLNVFGNYIKIEEDSQM